MSINRAIVSGNLTRDPELTATPSGTQVLHVGVAVNDRVKNQRTGEWEDRPNYLDCVVFGKRAESLSRILRKGAKVAVEGRLRQSRWETQDGQKRSKVEIVVDEVELMSARQAGQGPQGAYQPSQPGYGAPAPARGQAPAYAAPAPPQGHQQPPVYAAPAPAPTQSAAAELYDEDIPF